MENKKRFGVIRFVVRWGRLIPWLTALLSLGGVIAQGHVSSLSWALVALVSASVVWGVTRLAVELVDLVAETLLPR